MTQLATREFINGLPKAELHLHLEGTLEPELKLALAQKNGIDIGQSTIAEIRASYQFDSLASFLAVYYPAMDVLQTEDDFYHLAFTYLQKAHQENVRYAELFFDPQAHMARGIAFETVVNGFHRACTDAHAFNLDAHLIMCFLRDLSAESARQLLAIAKPYQTKILGIGLDSDEHHNPPLKFLREYGEAVAQGYRITMHADIDQVDAIQHIQQALEIIRVERLDHGTNIVENPDLVDWVAQLRIGLTACPLSNRLVADDMQDQEILQLMDHNVKVSINSDDPAYFGGYINDNYAAIAVKNGLTIEQIVQFAKNSFETAWISDAQKQVYLAEIDTYVADYFKK
ncbi:adenosine deaminase [Latilactobacillus graminis]|uniref:Adenine deaminase n=1 Tax=Latilactobacillus graminis DSM 20719 TaxID=1423752 RepID=A0AA89I1B6_9LACO|nr:adenosine deaminase [Latilactobacillus graminis]KRM23630.1 add protein [Latilactobacillus graminis DSM 20719]